MAERDKAQARDIAISITTVKKFCSTVPLADIHEWTYKPLTIIFWGRGGVPFHKCVH